MRRMRFRPAACLAVLLSLTCPLSARATSGEYLPVGDPLEAELRVLETLRPDERTGFWPERSHATHPGTRPARIGDLLAPTFLPDALDPVRRISALRLMRALARDVVIGPAADPRATPRLSERGDLRDGRFELSAGVEGRGEVARHTDPRFGSGSGMHLRGTAAIDRWTFHTHTVVGQIDGARAFADPIVPHSDLVAHTEETYLATGGDHWAAQFGRSRWAWGPGEEGSLTLSATAPAITGLAMSADLPALHVHAIALNATLGASAGEQLAAHRIEWQPAGALRIGATETARYRASGWRPLYAMGLLPYIFAQRLESQDEPDSLSALRNNIMLGADIAWRVAEGTRVYGELLVDDLHSKTGANPDKLAFQFGWDGAGAIGRSRVTWNGEYTRVSRYVYTSFFGRAYAAHGEPLGFPTGPDARRARVRVTWDPSADWQVIARAARTDQGANRLDQPFDPASAAPAGSPFDFEGTVERTRAAEAGLRWWPASGVDLTLGAGWTWVEGAGHVAGAKRDGPRGSLEVRLTR